MKAIMDIAEKNHLKVIEDAAHALPAKFNGNIIGTIGDLTAFSFYSTKNITTAEGGMLTGKSELIGGSALSLIEWTGMHGNGILEGLGIMK
jgi:dTDP-4-amino-4,6-dideoxygalactose transaminase